METMSEFLIFCMLNLICFLQPKGSFIIAHRSFELWRLNIDYYKTSLNSFSPNFPITFITNSIESSMPKTMVLESFFLTLCNAFGLFLLSKSNWSFQTNGAYECPLRNRFYSLYFVFGLLLSYFIRLGTWSSLLEKTKQSHWRGTFFFNKKKILQIYARRILALCNGLKYFIIRLL